MFFEFLLFFDRGSTEGGKCKLPEMVLKAERNPVFLI